MSRVRKSARGKPCTVRSEWCNNDPATTVLAHIRRPWNAGVGMKPRDSHAVYACSACHDVIDRRTKTGITKGDLDTMQLDALLRTITIQESE